MRPWRDVLPPLPSGAETGRRDGRLRADGTSVGQSGWNLSVLRNAHVPTRRGSQSGVDSRGTDRGPTDHGEHIGDSCRFSVNSDLRQGNPKMSTHNAANERIKRRYLTFLKEAKRQNDSSVDGVAEALYRFEAFSHFRDFKTFHVDLAIAFKRHLAETVAVRSGKRLSKATVYSTLSHLKRFFQWLASEPGYRAKLRYSDADYFNPSEKDARVATARRQRPFPTPEQVRHVLGAMPARTDIERRDRALVAFTFLTGARDSAVASARLKHVDAGRRCFHQDAREVDTKFSKTFPTYFFSVGGDAEAIVADWVEYLRDAKLWGNDDPLFPATVSKPDASGLFHAAGLSREPWKTASPIRAVFKQAFALAGLPYFNPHSFRHTLVELGQQVCQSPEEYKAWSQNLGHDGVLTTFTSYGTVLPERQAQILRTIGERSPAGAAPQSKVAELVRFIQALDL